ncbi:hypothetical protein HMPREF7215_2073 [Pyramidobacter piscolens W5455]|uniref:Uncharacterized protein n=1 Tax=Pyramidobacter piscolens W5455 TaxID=352165 RepID=A0ABM9ZTM4_9BACT|nr:hypothetical protein HMPREF7215_2073 [Pyramidobacter piscolens W5455]
MRNKEEPVSIPQKTMRKKRQALLIPISIENQYNMLSWLPVYVRGDEKCPRNMRFPKNKKQKLNRRARRTNIRESN